MKLTNKNYGWPFVLTAKHTCARCCLLLMLFCLQVCAANKAVAQIPADVHRVLFLGNSITYAGGYVTDVEAWFVTHYPNRQIEFINAGLPSETVSGLSEEGHAGGAFPRPDLHERLARVLAQTKPDLVFACYGMNDGIYLPFDEGRFARFKEGVNWLHDTVVKTGAKIIHLTPPIFDELKGGHPGYAAVLNKYSGWLLEQRKQQGWQVCDLHYPMKKYLEAHRKVDKAFGMDGFALAQDGVHPGETGHWLMAKQILLYLGEKSVKNVPTINAGVTVVAKGGDMLRLVAERQAMMKDAWLTATGHKRPGMNKGIPLVEAQAKAAAIGLQIKALQGY
jgi:lysophospholipase L1-like esterase